MGLLSFLDHTDPDRHSEPLSISDFEVGEVWFANQTEKSYGPPVPFMKVGFASFVRLDDLENLWHGQADLDALADCDEGFAGGNRPVELHPAESIRFYSVRRVNATLTLED